MVSAAVAPAATTSTSDVPADDRASQPTPAQQVGVGREGGAQLGHLGPDRRDRGLVVAGPQGPADQAGDGRISVGPMPAVVSAAVPRRRPEVTNGRAGVVGDGVAVEGDAGPVEHLLGLLAGELGVEGAQVDQDQVVVGAARDQAEALAGQGRGQGGGVGHHGGGVLAELRPGRLGEGHRLGRDDVLERAALQAREDGAVDLLGQVGAAQDGAAPGAAQRLVGREGDHVGHADRARVGAAGDQAGRVGGVEHEQGPDRVGDLPERQRVDDAGVGGGAGHDERGLLALGQVGHLVEVDDLARVARVVGGRGHPVGDEPPDLGGDGGRRAVGEVAAVVEPHGQNGVARLEQGLVDGEVGVGPGVGLHVGVLGAEEGRGPVAGQVLDLVDDLVAAVVALPG